VCEKLAAIHADRQSGFGGICSFAKNLKKIDEARQLLAIINDVDKELNSI
jgi:hypothetical protein